MPGKPRRRQVRSQLALTVDHLWAKAVQMFEAADFSGAETTALSLLRSDPNRVQAWHLAAVAAAKLKRLDDSIARLQKCVAIDVQYAAGWKDLGSLCYNAQRFEESQQALRGYLKLKPHDTSIMGLLGTVLQSMQRLEDAAECFQQALEIHADDWRLYEGLASVYQISGRHEDTIACLLRALKCSHCSPDIHRQLVAAYRCMGQLAKAAEAAAAWQALDPTNPTAQHMLAALGRELAPERAPDEYISQVFDQFSKNFNQHLASLKYRAPELMVEIVSRVPLNDALILDAGCGTGLCGTSLRPLASRLVGVDLSAGMLEQAEQLKVYDELHQMELTAFLTECQVEFDWIVSADTLIYFGNLIPVLEQARRVLKPNGHLVFTLEEDSQPEETPSYRLQPNGRYVHRPDQVIAWLRQVGFVDIHVTSEILREEAGKPVKGLLIQCLNAR
ncbi:MAG: methyltransferase domain-containing protein [Pirellulaceae bacterium]|nr:methyltransferase domain-containing protein [Pirellulaceae bacterium]